MFNLTVGVGLKMLVPFFILRTRKCKIAKQGNGAIRLKNI